MYKKFCRRKGFTIKEIRRCVGRIGTNELRLKVCGGGAYSWLIREAGGHRVQRVPPTEAGSRRHTSTITVAVLREEEIKEIQVGRDDVEFSASKSGGHGGMNVNKRSTAVRLKHRETGEVVSCREERRQGQNKQKAMKKLERRLNRKNIKKQVQQETRERKEQVGSGMRGDKIRTYNYRENKITDHRSGKSTRRLREIVEQGRLDLIYEGS